MAGQDDALLLRRARIAGVLVDIRLAAGRVASVAPHGSPPAGSDAEVVDLDGATLMPGLVDHHVHLAQWAAARQRVPLEDARGPGEVARQLAAAPGDGLVVGRGFADALWPEPPHRDALDAALPDRPAVAVSHDLHTVWLNGSAARRFGVDTGTGVLVEDAAMQVQAVLAGEVAAALDDQVLQATDAAARRGVTAVRDFENADPQAWARRRRPSVRVRAGLWPQWTDDARALGLRTGDRLPGIDERVRLGPAKLFVDGSLGTRTAWCDDAYPGGGHGVLVLPAEPLTGRLQAAAAAGWRVAVHAIGDAAVRIALDAFAASGARGTVEHAQQVHPADLPRFAAIGVAASIQPRHAPDDRDVADRHWAAGVDRAFPYAALHAAGARLLLGSDAPVAPLDPWDAIAAAVHRSVDDREPWHPEQHLTLAVALRAATGRGGVSVGDAADLAVLADRPADVLAARGVDGLRRIGVLGTLLGGRWTHRDGV